MIVISDKENCCGCGACVSVCPKKCIVMHSDSEGFLYPKVDESICVNCGLCEKVCPCLNRIESNKIDDSYTFYALKNQDSIDLNRSSSGAIFPLLAREILNRGGVVFGARWNDDFEVVHTYCEKETELKLFQGSKYVQSKMGDNFRKAKEFLDAGRYVLFSGVPCQILGLKKYLRKDYPNLFAVDILCHSTTSPLVWKFYLESVLGTYKKESIANIKFRKKFKDKNGNIESSMFSIEFKDNSSLDIPFGSTSFAKAFYSYLISRRSCYKCPVCNLKSLSDLTIGDFWGAEKHYPNLAPHSGLNIVIAKTDKADSLIKDIFQHCSIKMEVKKSEILLNGGLNLGNFSRENIDRETFFLGFEETSDECKAIFLERFVSNIFRRLKNKIRRMLKKYKKKYIKK